ncbi:MAG: sigma-54 dependent transcriptional regulator [Acidobacteriota bacterium]
MAETLGILVVEDESDQRRLLVRLLATRGYNTLEAADLATARRILASTAEIDLVLTDWKLPDGDGIELLETVRERSGNERERAAFVMVTAYGTIARAVEAIRAGADDYLTKPFERQALMLAIERALEKRRLENENRRLSAELDERDRLVDLVGKAPTMQRLFRQVEKLAGTSATVLITGESGTGKELAARALHALSARKEQRFVAVNCAAIPETLVESELFGVEKGAFTGAEKRPGTFASAHGGTLFLDEVGELPLAVQPKLLRALQEGTVTRVGSSREEPVDVRIITATNRDLRLEAREGRFREDLYYRLAVVPLTMPPLRERREDIPLLVRHFLARSARRHALPKPKLSRTATRQLLDHTWPGNVRELGNVVERLVLLAEDGEIQDVDLSEAVASTQEQGGGAFSLPPEGMSWEAHERDCLSQALTLAAGNRARAARLLDLPYKAFLYRLDKHGI